jgi:hypothetical protein
MTFHTCGSTIEHPDAYDRATKMRIIMNARTTFERTYPDAIQLIDYVQGKGIKGEDKFGHFTYMDNFFGSLASALHTYGKLSPNQVAAVRKCMAKDDARRAEWADKRAAENATKEHIGEIGKRMEMRLTVRHIVELEGFYGTSYIFICDDAANNTVIYKGTSRDFSNKGETALVTATIKDHGVREGVKQTIIQRPKVTALLVPYI